MLKIKTLNLVGAIRVPGTSSTSSYLFVHVPGTGHAASGGVDDIQIAGELLYIRKGNAHRIVHVGAALEFELQPGQSVGELGFDDPYATKSAPVTAVVVPKPQPARKPIPAKKAQPASPPTPSSAA